MTDFFGGGGKSLSFGKAHDMTYAGKIRGGKVVNIGEPKQQTHIQTGVPQVNKDGSPKLELPISLVCIGGGDLLRAAYASDPKVAALLQKYGRPLDERTDPTDDGRRRLWVKGSSKMAIGKAMEEHGLKMPEIGSELYLIFTGQFQSFGEFEGRCWDVLYIPAPSQAEAFMAEGQQPVHVATAVVGGQMPPAPQQAAPMPSFASPQPPAAAPAASAPPVDPWGTAPPAQPTAQPAAANPYGAAPNAQTQSNDPWA